MRIEPILSGVAEVAQVFRKRKATVRGWFKDGAPHEVEWSAEGKKLRILVDRQELKDWLRRRKREKRL